MTSKYKLILLAALGVSAQPGAFAAEDADSLNAENQIQLAYHTIDKDDVLGGVEVLDVESLLEKNYINNIDNSTISGYVSGFNGNSLWGMDADNDAGFLVLIDGVARDMNNVSSTEVKSITFMKGAQASVLYGSRAAKGVIYITTKRGHEGPLRINVRANTGWHVAKSTPEYLGAAEYMTLYNEARRNDNLGAAYSDEQIYHTANKTNIYRYPDVNMYSDEYMNKVYNRSDATVEISGGNQRARFYTNINYYRLGDYLKYGEAEKNYTDRFSVRGNIDVNIAEWVSAYVNADATFYGARSAHGNFWEAASTFRPNRITPLIPISQINPDAADALKLVGNSNHIKDGCFLAGTQIDRTNIFADYLAKGYTKFTSRQFQFDAGVNLDLGMLAKGLTFGTRFSVDYATSYNTNYTDSYATFIPVWANFNGKDEIVDIVQEGKDEHSGVQNVTGSASRQTLSWSGQFDYNRTFADVHNLHALAVAAGWQRTVAGEYHRTSSANIGFEVEYNYDHRYYADLALVGLHSAKLAPGHRQGWSPSATIGWRISQEDFLKDNSIVNNLMISASVADVKSDMDIPGYYLYATQFTSGGWYQWAPGGTAAAYPTRGSNPGLGYISRKELTASVRGSFFNNLLDVNAQFFTYKTDGLVINNSSKFPTFFSTYYPASSFATYLNYDANRRTGFDFGVNVKKTVGEVDLNFGVTGTYYKTKATKRDEVREYAYQNRQGKMLDGIWGYRCLGFFATDEEAAAADQSALGGQTLRAGDLKYEDINNDGKIDDNDQVLLARGGWYGAPFFMGVNLSASWKGFTIFVRGLGNFGGHGTLNGNSYYKMVGDNKYSAIARDRWTSPETVTSSTMPRLTTTNGANNYVTSDFWLYSTDRFELDKIQITYDFPSSIIHGLVKGLQVYVSGDDLLTIGKNRKIMEMNVGSAPQSRFYNIGAKVTF